MSGSAGRTCGNYDNSQEKLQDEISKIASSMGMDQQCEREITASSESSHFEMHADYEVSSFLGSAGGSVGLSMSDADAESSLAESGCGTALADIKSVIDERYKIACDINETSVSSQAAVSARASINITAVGPGRDPPDTLVPPTPVNFEGLAGLRMAGFSSEEVRLLYQQSIDSYQKSLLAYEKMLKIYAPAEILGSGSVIQNTVSLNVKTLSQLDVTTVSRIAESVKKIAETAATSEISQTAGFSGSNSRLNQMVSSYFDSKDTEISMAINTIQESSQVSVSADGNIEIFSSAGSIDITGARITNDIAIELLTEKIVDVSLDLGKKYASEVITSASSSTTTSQDFAGFDDVIAEVQAGLAARLAALQNAQNERPRLGNDWMKYLVILGIIGGGGAIGGSGRMTPIKIVMLLVLLYLALAWFFGWFPFNFFSFLSLAFRKVYRRDNYKNSSNNQSRKELRMNPKTVSYRKKSNLYKSASKLANRFKNQSSVQDFISPREYLKTKSPYGNTKSYSSRATYDGSSIRSRPM